MKKIFYTFMAMSAALSIAGCAKELEEPEQTPGDVQEEESGYMVLGASLPNSDDQAGDTKTAIADNGDKTYSVNWSEADRICVNGETSKPANIDAGNAKKASFTLPASLKAPYCAVYPADAYIAGTYFPSEAKDSLNITVPATQEYVKDGIDPNSAIMLAYSKDGSELSFRHAMAYLKLTVNGADVKSIRINGNYNEAISGIFKYSASSDGKIVFGAQINSQKKATTPNTSITYAADEYVTAGTPMFIAIPAALYSNGLTLTVVDGEGHYQVIKSTTSFTASAGKVYPTSVNFDSKEIYIDGGIYTVEDWNAFIASVNDGTWAESKWNCEVDGKKGAHLMADIYSLTNLPKTNDKLPDKITKCEWNGIFYGHNHTLTHNGYEQLFTNVGADGKIQNLTVAGLREKNGTEEKPTNAWPSVIALNNAGEINNCESKVNFELSGSSTNAAGICRTNTGKIIDCKNTGKISIENPTTAVNVAGIVMNSSGTLTGCTNECEIKITGVDQNCIIGGIVQSVCGTAVSNLTNNAAISVEAALTARRTIYVGGVVANAEYGEKCSKLVECKNCGALSIKKSGKKFIQYGAIGGVVAAINQGAKGTEGDTFTSLTNCSNAGHISFYESETESTSIGYAFGGIVGRCVYFSDKNFHYGDGGYYMVMRNGNNTGNITVYAANGQKAATGNSGARQTYVGGLAGFVAGTSDKAIVRGKSNCTITTGSALGGDIAGGLVGGGAMLSIDTNPTATTTFKPYNDAKVGFWGAALGWTTSKSNVRIDKADVNATYGTDTPAGKGFAGVMGDTKTKAILTATSCKYNGNAVTASDIYGGGTLQ